MSLRCVIVDDEPLAREGLAKYVEVIDYLNLVTVAENPLELHHILETEQIDLVFLDIQMPFMTGIDFLKIKSNLPMIILTTAYPNYALEGFTYDVVDYLLKPITFNRFFKATNKAKELFHLKNAQNEHITFLPEPDFLFVKCDNKYEKIITNDILFVRAFQNYVLIHTEKMKYMTLMTLKSVEEQLDAERFIRVHKSYLVAVSKIERIEAATLNIFSHQIPISRNQKEQVLTVVLKNKLLGKNS